MLVRTQWLRNQGEFGHTVELTMGLLVYVHDIFVLAALGRGFSYLDAP